MKIRPAPILPRLPQAEFEQLKASIAEHGILRPLFLAMDGTIIDGNERYRALIEIGGDTRKIRLRVFGKMTERQRKEYAIRCNCERRQLNRAERHRLLLKYIRAAPEKSTRAIADACRVPHRTAARAKARCATGTPTLGRDGKTYGPRPAASSSESIHGAGLIGRFLGCEIDPVAHKIASNRIEAELRALGGRSTPATARV